MISFLDYYYIIAEKQSLPFLAEISVISVRTSHKAFRIEVPLTSGVTHNARLGSMEGNVFSLIGNRMKGRRACRRVDGGNHLAA